MKQKIVTLLGVVVMIGAIVLVRSVFEKDVITEAKEKAAEEAKENLAEAAEITEEAKAAEAASPAEEASAPAVTDIEGFEAIAEWPDAAPEVFRVKFDTSVGPFVIESHQSWAPIGHARFYELCKVGFFNEARFFRVIHGFMVQFGLAADPKMSAQYAESNLMDEPVRKSNQRGKVTFAKSSMPNSRSSQLFINYGDNARLDSDGFSPFAEVVFGMENVEKITDKFGEQPRQDYIRSKGNEYLKKLFPELDYIKTVTLVK